MKTKNVISIYSSEEIGILREAGKILASVVSELTCSLKSGLTTYEVDQIAEDLIKQKGVLPAFKGYRGFPGCICASVNEVVVHGIPSEYHLKDGDIFSIDVGIIYKGYYSDTAITVPIGDISTQKKRLLEVTQTSLMKGIAQAKLGNHVSDISHAIQVSIEKEGLGIVREFVGHGIGRNLHEDPEIPNFGKPNSGPELKVGMVFAIEPMVNLGDWQTRILDDGWTVVTKDEQASAHFEHSIVITKDGPEILTKI